MYNCGITKLQLFLTTHMAVSPCQIISLPQVSPNHLKHTQYQIPFLKTFATCRSDDLCNLHEGLLEKQKLNLILRSYATYMPSINFGHMVQVYMKQEEENVINVQLPNSSFEEILVWYIFLSLEQDKQTQKIIDEQLAISACKSIDFKFISNAMEEKIDLISLISNGATENRSNH